MKSRPLITPNPEHASTPELKALLLREERAQEALHKATEDYEKETQEIRCEIGNRIRELREAFGVPQAQLGAAIGLARNGLYTAECPQESGRYFSVARLLEIHAACVPLLRLGLPKINRGRPKKDK